MRYNDKEKVFLVLKTFPKQYVQHRVFHNLTKKCINNRLKRLNKKYIMITINGLIYIFLSNKAA